MSPSAPLRVVSDQGDQVRFTDPEDWRFTETAMENGKFIRTIQNVVSGQDEAIQLDSMFAWHNDIRPEDVDNNGEVTPNDILEVIDQLVDRRYIQPDSDTPVSPEQVDVWPNRFFDTSGDNEISPLDILVVIEYLAEERANRPSGELVQFAANRANIDQVLASGFLSTRSNEDSPSERGLVTQEMVKRAISTAREIRVGERIERSNHSEKRRDTNDSVSSVGSKSSDSDPELSVELGVSLPEQGA